MSDGYGVGFESDGEASAISPAIVSQIGDLILAADIGLAETVHAESTAPLHDGVYKDMEAGKRMPSVRHLVDDRDDDGFGGNVGDYYSVRRTAKIAS